MKQLDSPIKHALDPDRGSGNDTRENLFNVFITQDTRVRALTLILIGIKWSHFLFSRNKKSDNLI